MTEIAETPADSKDDIATLMANDQYDGTCQAANRTIIFEGGDLDGNDEIYETFYKPLCQTQMNVVFEKESALVFCLEQAALFGWTLAVNRIAEMLGQKRGEMGLPLDWAISDMQQLNVRTLPPEIADRFADLAGSFCEEKPLANMLTPLGEEMEKYLNAQSENLPPHEPDFVKIPQIRMEDLGKLGQP